jgi:choline dehydrogenase
MRFEKLSVSVALAALAVMARPSAAVTYDYVIVGAGAAGLLLANRLTENPDISVAIIDPGGDQENNTMVSDPNAWLAPNDAPPDWDYTSLPQPHAADRSVAFHAGKGLGGSTLINGKLGIGRGW